MSASYDFRKLFSKKSLSDIYFSSVRYKSTIGIDRINSKTFESNLSENIDVIYRKSRNGTYRFSQYREKLLSRGQKKFPRLISIPTLRDKLVLKALSGVLSSAYETYVPFLHNIVGEVSTLFNSCNYNSFLRLDVKNFYPSINHDLLLNELKKKILKKEILNLIENAVSQATVAKPEGKPKLFISKGIPQGLAISNILANIYMIPLDKKHTSSLTYKYFRYVDDILILCNSSELNLIQDEITQDCSDIKLELYKESDHSSKSSSGKIVDGFLYLGYEFGSKGITVKKKSVDKLRESLIKILTNYKYSKTDDLALLNWAINLRVTGCIFNKTKYGWLFFFSQINDLPLLYSLDHFITKQIIRFGIDASKIKTKKFVRSYYKITKSISKTKYIPNFDKYLFKEKKQILKEVFGLQTESMNNSEIQHQFNKRIYRTISDLEKDLGKTS